MTIITIIAIALAVLFAAAAVIILYHGADKIEDMEGKKLVAEMFYNQTQNQLANLPFDTYGAVDLGGSYAVKDGSNGITVWLLPYHASDEASRLYARRRAEEVAEMLNDKN